MPEFKFTEIPPFAKRDGDALLFHGPGSLEYYIPDVYFIGGKSTSAAAYGAYFKLLGSFNYRLIDENGNLGKLKTFTFPTMFLCKPHKTETRKNIQLDPALEPSDYVVLSFVEGDQLINSCHVPQDIDNVGEVIRLHIQTGKIPNSIPYNELYKYLFDAMVLNSGTYAVHSQAMGLIYSKVCRDPDDISKVFRLSKHAKSKMTGYTPISIKEVAKYISPFGSIALSENLDDSIVSSVMLSDDEKTGKREHKYSPLERVLMM